MKVLIKIWCELRKLRYLRHGFRNYWFGEDMPELRTWEWLRRKVEGS
jgi:hypothetical protein